MLLSLDGASLTYGGLVDLAHGRATARFAPGAVERMEKARRIAEAAAERRQRTYGLTTGVGAPAIRRASRPDTIETGGHRARHRPETGPR